ncbi:CNH domain-containing protein [Scheffersomyces amazonensis]|uniref:CNH domain-containing protein n=1 Tax=Scheffersomyces amazonensis TaxID=1078765 RepID=UPI00315CAF37
MSELGDSNRTSPSNPRLRRRPPPPVTESIDPLPLTTNLNQSLSTPTIEGLNNNNYSNNTIATTPTHNSYIDYDTSGYQMSLYNESPGLNGPRELSDYGGFDDSFSNDAPLRATTYNSEYFQNKRRSYQQLSRSVSTATVPSPSPIHHQQPQPDAYYQDPTTLRLSPQLNRALSTPLHPIQTNNITTPTRISVIDVLPSRTLTTNSYISNGPMTPPTASSPTRDRSSFLFSENEHEEGYSPISRDSDFNRYGKYNLEEDIELINRQIESLAKYTQYIYGNEGLELPSLPPVNFDKNRDSMYPIPTSVPSPPSPSAKLDQKLKDGKLPLIPVNLQQKSNFQANLLREKHFAECKNISSLSSIYKWCLSLRNWSHAIDIPTFAFKMTIFKLIVSKLSFEFSYYVKCTTEIINELMKFKCIIYVTYDNPDSHIRILDGGYIPELYDTYIFKSIDLNDNSNLLGDIELTENIDIQDVIKNNWKVTLPITEKKINVIAEMVGSEILFRTNVKLYIKGLVPDFGLLVRKEFQDQSFEDNLSKWAEEILKIHETYILKPLLKLEVSDEPEKLNSIILLILNIYFTWSQKVRNPLKEHFFYLPGRLYYLSKYKDILDSVPKIKESSQNAEMLVNSAFARYSKINLQLEKFKNSGLEEYVEISMRSITDLGLEVNQKIDSGHNRFHLGRIQRLLTWPSSLPKPDIDWNNKNRKFVTEGQALRSNLLTKKVMLIVLDNFVFITDEIDKRNEAQVIDYIPGNFLLIEKKSVSVPTNTVPNQANSTQIDSVQFRLTLAGAKGFLFTSNKNLFESLLIPKEEFFRKSKKNLPYSVNLISNNYFVHEWNYEPSFLQLYSELDPTVECSTLNIPKEKIVKYKEGKEFPGEFTTSQLRCSSSFEYHSKRYVLVGSDSGLFCSDPNGKWKKVMDGENIKKIRILESKNLVFFLSKKKLKYFTLEKLLEMYERGLQIASCNLLSEGEVEFFEAGQYGKEHLVIYGKKDGIKTSLRAKIPTTEHGGIFNGFTSKDPFYDPGECNGISIFRDFVAVHSNRNFSIMNLDHLDARLVSDKLKINIDELNNSTGNVNIKSGLASIRAALNSSDAKPLGMFKVKNSSKNEFILAYRKFAIFVNKDIKLTRSSLFEYNFWADSVACKNNHLIIVKEDVIEIWAIREGDHSTRKLVQVLAGKDIKMLNGNSLLFSMSNPVFPKFKLVFQLKLISK